MPSVVKRKLSSCTDGRGIKIAASASTGTAIHTATSATTDGSWDEIWLWAYNSHTSTVSLTVEFGGTTAPDDNITTTLDSKAGLVPIVPGLILQNSAVVRAYSSTTTNVVSIFGFVNRITE